MGEALRAGGIVLEVSRTSTGLPFLTLTRGEVDALVWLVELAVNDERGRLEIAAPLRAGELAGMHEGPRANSPRNVTRDELEAARERWQRLSGHATRDHEDPMYVMTGWKKAPGLLVPRAVILDLIDQLEALREA